jgi:hypothetical protein
MPGDADTYLLKNVIHDWDDDRATGILRCCRQSMRPDARLFVIERRMPEVATPNATLDAFMTDLEMLVMTAGGRERTEAEFAELLAKAGFTLVRTTPTASAPCVFEARPT